MNIKANKPPVPGLFWGHYPERDKPLGSSILNGIPYFKAIINKAAESKAKQVIRQVRTLDVSAPAFKSNAYQTELHALQANLRRDGFTDQLVCQAFALINKAFTATMHVELFDTQLLAAYYMLNNRLAEMATGEGKTYAVALAASTAALCGVPVHVITANNYLAERDANNIQILCDSLGLTVGAVAKEQTTAERRLAYVSDITYCTAKELVFDYLRDKLTKQNLTPALVTTPEPPPTLLNGLCMAIIDEADSILIDEASVPLILSEADELQQQHVYYNQSLSIASQLRLAHDFQLDQDNMKVTLTHHGQSKLEATAMTLPMVWHNKGHREESVSMALAALHLYQRDHHYVVNNGMVSMIDSLTGRIAEGRSWAGGLHQLIELKEGCTLRDNLSTIAQITYQQFFPKYLKLGGISGTLVESSHELQQTYGLAVSKVPLRIPSKRKLLPMRIYPSLASRNDALIAYVTQLHQSGRPILIATESVKESEQLSTAMHQHKLKHQILNARHDKDEANRISRAGNQFAITITTNMAGRGTDIKLSDMVNRLGGIHVISCQVNGSKRIDRQLIGRAARQGQEGSAEQWITLENKLIEQRLPNWLINILRKNITAIPNGIIQGILAYVQWVETNHQAALRKHLLRSHQAIKKLPSLWRAT